MKQIQKETLVGFFKAVGQAERVKLLGLVASRPYTIQELAESLAIPQTAIIHHIKRLQQANLLHEAGETITLNGEALAQLNTKVLTAGESEDKASTVLAHYVAGQQLKSMPTDYSERRIILDWLANRFAVGQKYTQNRIEFVLSGHTSQPELVRQLLEENNFLQRRGQIFWRAKKTLVEV